MDLYLTAGLTISLLIAGLISAMAARRLLPGRQRSQMPQLARLAWFVVLLLSLPTALLVSLFLYGQISREVFLRETGEARFCAQNAAGAVAKNSASRAWDWRWHYEACLDEMRAVR